jgi:nucleoside 2-deoxyribosyltransferase
MEYLVYLSGPISGLVYDEAQDWRSQFAARIHPAIKTLSPLRGKQLLQQEGILHGTYEKFPAATSKAIMGRDRFDTLRADAVVVNLLGATKVSIGTVMEIAWADAHRVPIILIMEKTGNIHDHSMLKEAITYWVDNLEDGVLFTNVLLLPDHQQAIPPAVPTYNPKPTLNTGRQDWGTRDPVKHTSGGSHGKS